PTVIRRTASGFPHSPKPAPSHLQKAPGKGPAVQWRRWGRRATPTGAMESAIVSTADEVLQPHAISSCEAFPRVWTEQVHLNAHAAAGHFTAGRLRELTRT